MQTKLLLFSLLTLCISFGLKAQAIVSEKLLNNAANFKSLNVAYSNETYLGKESLKLIELYPQQFNEDKLLYFSNVEFKNGSIELYLSGNPSDSAFTQARGFVGVAFHINADHSKFECIYLRPTNGRANDQLRRNHTVQYVSFPDYPWHKLRKEEPSKYETYLDISPNEWIKVRIQINDQRALLFVNDASQPTLIVNDLKLGDQVTGSVGLWIGPGTEAHFANLVLLSN